MKTLLYLRGLSLAALSGVIVLGVVGCAADDPSSAASGPGVENPAASSSGSVVPAVGVGGNGGGISGGGAGAGARN